MKMDSRPKGMDYKGHQAMCKASGEEPMDEDEYNALPEKDEDEDEEEEEEDEESEKGDIAIADLQKSLDALAAQRTALGAGSRAEYLETRLRAGTLSKSEREELGRIWSSDGTAEEPTGDPATDLRKGMADVDAQMIDASSALAALEKGIEAAIAGLGALMKSETGRVHAQVAGVTDVIVNTAKTAITTGRLVKALVGRMTALEAAPAPRRGVTSPHAPVRTRGLPGGDALTKAEIGRGIEILVSKAAAAADDDALDALSLAAARFESGVPLPTNTEAAIRAVTRPN